jgi:hypothetical protein
MAADQGVARATGVVLACVATITLGALGHGAEPRPGEEQRVTGIVRGFVGASLALRDPQSGATRNFDLSGHLGPIRADSIGLRLGDTAVVTVRADAAREAWAIDRALPDGQTTIRVFALNQAFPALAQGQGCWIAVHPGESIELCFTSVSRGVALRYDADGAFACAAPLQLQGARFAAAPTTCRDGGRWPVQSVACDGKASCRLALIDAAEQILAMTRR